MWRFWLDIPEQNRAWLEIVVFIPYERIINIDKDGDEYFRHPHIYVECTPKGEFFEEYYQEVLSRTMLGPQTEIYFPKTKDRVKYFPKKFPKPKPPNQTNALQNPEKNGKN